ANTSGGPGSGTGKGYPGTATVPGLCSSSACNRGSGYYGGYATNNGTYCGGGGGAGWYGGASGAAGPKSDNGGGGGGSGYCNTSELNSCSGTSGYNSGSAYIVIVWERFCFPHPP
ncbi:MAG: hypothetical protein LBP39_01435, partial [Rickettsiales bacterium]|nr:hypothetical protein [Rickettsiales bacterium]